MKKMMKHPRMKMPKMGGGYSSPLAEGSPQEEAGESPGMEASEDAGSTGGQGFKRGGHVGMHKAGHDGHKHMESSTKHSHKSMHRA